jgi:D-alanine-D-alanine ligase
MPSERPGRVILLAGGESEEHEVSLQGAQQVLAQLQERYAVQTLVISKQGALLSPEASQLALGNGQAPLPGPLLGRELELLKGAEVVFPLLHGPLGEDGTVQGLLRLAHLPFVGSGVLASALCMDKAMSKQILGAAGLEQVRWALLTRGQFRSSPEATLEQVQQLGFPVFIKPANLGSSVGITKARDTGQLQLALEQAFALDRRVIAEAMAAEHPVEIEVGVLGNDELLVSPAGEIRYPGDFYDYATKYTEGAAELVIPAEIPDAVANLAREQAALAFSALDCAGLARVDFFYLPESGRLLINEVNTMPGFTPTSMYPKLFEAAGLSYGALIDRLLQLALERR